MNIRGLSFLIQRRWKEIMVITIVTVLCSYGLSRFKNQSQYETTIFLSIGAADLRDQSDARDQTKNSPLDLIQAADQFSETVQGWFKNPEFIQTILAQSKTYTDFSARKQEKQNLVVTFAAGSHEAAKNIVNAVKAGLSAEIEKYNLKTGSRFELALYSSFIETKPANLMLFLMLGLLFGLIIGTATGYFYEYFFDLAMDENQVSSLMHKEYLEKFQSLQSQKPELLAAVLKKEEARKITIAGVNFTPLALQKKLQAKLPHAEIKTIRLPENLGEATHGKLLLVVRLGVTQLEDLTGLKAFLPEHFELIIVQT